MEAGAGETGKGRTRGSSAAFDRELLHRALELPEEERVAFLTRELPAGPARDRALRLLDDVAGLGSFMATPYGVAEEYRPPLPHQVAGYRIEGLLGWGSMGVVYRARQKEPQRDVALKVLRMDNAQPSAQSRFRREAQVLGELGHPGIATIYEAGHANLGAGVQPWFAMEFVDGSPIDVHAREAGLDVRDRVRLVLQAARAVDHAHSCKVVHRDLKPENVLVREDGRVCVLDFGVASWREDERRDISLTVTGQLIGTVAYMAPEQARGESTDAQGDQFALAVILYELLTGARPFDTRGLPAHAALRVIAEAKWTPPSRHDPALKGDLEAVLGMALAPEPGRRYSSVGAFADDLERWLQGRAVVAIPPTIFDGLWRVARRNPFLLASSVVALLLLGGLVAVVISARVAHERESRLAGLFLDRAILTELKREADELWPANGARAPAIDRWLARTRALLGRAPRLRSELEAFMEQGARIEARAGAEFSETWLIEVAHSHLAELEEVAAPRGLLEQLSGRSRHAHSLLDRTVTEHLEVWTDVLEALRDDDRFATLALSPQEGLVPLGPDPVSGLQEFAAVCTGAVPVRSPGASVAPVLGDAVILVLVPGGECWIGSQREDRKGPNFSARRTDSEEHHGPPFQVRLDPFLIGKFELTQDQWQRTFGFNPSDWEAGSVIRESVITSLNPVESISWIDALEYLGRCGMTLPTEAQWEVAARANSESPFVVGPGPESLVGYVNWARSIENQQDPANAHDPDRWYTHCPVGQFAPNPFGLHDTLGNVWEQCLDVFKVAYHDLPHREGDGLVLAEPDGDVSRRGAGAFIDIQRIHVYNRQYKRFDSGATMTGVRPVRRWPTAVPGGPFPPPGPPRTHDDRPR